MTSRLFTPAAFLLTTFAAILPAQAAPAPVQATPSTAPAPAKVEPPVKASIPPGFERITVNGRVALVESTDKPWVTKALNDISPSKSPATLPATLLARIQNHRASLLTAMSTDLAISDSAAIAESLDKNVVTPLRDLDQIRPQMLFLVASAQRVGQLLKSGWTDPHFYYNRVADAVAFNPSATNFIDRPMDEAVFPASYGPDQSDEKRIESITNAVAATERGIASAIETRGRVLLSGAFTKLIQDLVINPLDLKLDQTWFGLGVSSELSVKYVAFVAGIARQELIVAMLTEHPDNPLKSTAVNLLQPTDPNLIRDEAKGAYIDTVRRKSTRVIHGWVEKAGEGAIPKTLAAVREQKPADGAALVKIIKEQTGVDLTNDLSR